MGKTIRRSFIKTWMGESTDLGMYVRPSKNQGFVCQYMKMTSKWLERYIIWHPCGKDDKSVDIDEPASFLDHVYLGYVPRECKPNDTIIEQYNKMFESRFSVGATEQSPGWKKPHAQTVAWSYDMEGHAQTCVEGYCELANKKVEQLYKVPPPCLDDHQFKKGGIGISWRIVRSLLTNGLDMLVLGTNWTT